MRKVVSGIVIRDLDYLLVRKGEAYFFPGGKPNEGEDDEPCLRREFAEELSGTQIENIRPYQVIPGKSPHVGDRVEVHYYLVDIKGQVGAPSAEINGAVWADRQDSFDVTESARKAIERLIADRLI